MNRRVLLPCVLTFAIGVVAGMLVGRTPTAPIAPPDAIILNYPSDDPREPRAWKTLEVVPERADPGPGAWFVKLRSGDRFTVVYRCRVVPD